ncbi:MAG: hypothetical protein QG574_4129 [Cyanobacteriota bacterium erpe_2018_sw_21hr_WHONDRS-SW48-000092_B_bin.40]|jgi:hypothetical protein|nr:hypothetical protein [Cyanobacteriota bacterium erpe_2018_sw_21hr_WHONDRS-SW48-000092_B_bin.40]
MGRAKQKVAFAKEVIIKRSGETATIDFLDKSLGGTHLTICPQITEMSDADILRLYNDIVLTQERMIADFRPTEMQEGLPQIGIAPYYKDLTIYSQTLRCEVTSGESPDDTVIEIDDKQLTWSEFGKLISPYIGLGMRIQFMASEQLVNPPDSVILNAIPGDK